MKVNISQNNRERVEFERYRLENASLRRENDKLRKVLSQITDLVNNNSAPLQISSRKKPIKRKNIANKRLLKSRQEKETMQSQSSWSTSGWSGFDSGSSVYFTAKSSFGSSDESTCRSAVSDDKSDEEMESFITDDAVRCSPAHSVLEHPNPNSDEFSLTMPNISLCNMRSSSENVKKWMSGWSDLSGWTHPNGRFFHRLYHYQYRILIDCNFSVCIFAYNFAPDLSMMQGPFPINSTPMHQNVQRRLSFESFVCSTVPNTPVRRKHSIDSSDGLSINSFTDEPTNKKRRTNQNSTKPCDECSTVWKTVESSSDVMIIPDLSTCMLFGVKTIINGTNPELYFILRIIFFLI